MLDWLKANMFLAGMSLTAAGVFFAFFTLIRVMHFALDVERSLVGCAAIATLFVTAFIWQRIHRHIARRR